MAEAMAALDSAPEGRCLLVVADGRTIDGDDASSMLTKRFPADTPGFLLVDDNCEAPPIGCVALITDDASDAVVVNAVRSVLAEPHGGRRAAGPKRGP